MPLPTAFETLELIRSRRTVKPPLYDGQPVPEAVVSDLLEAATWAPTHGMNQPWRFRVYAGREAMDRLENILVDLYATANPPEDQKPEKVEKLRQNTRASGTAIAVFVDRGAPGKIPFLEDVMAVACAVQNLMLAARAHGIGSFWSTNTVDYSEPPKAVFPSTAPGQRYLGVIFLGRPRGSFPESARKPVRQILQDG